MDRLFWIAARRLWPKWKQVLIMVTPETVVRWHRAGFRMYWSWLSRRTLEEIAGAEARRSLSRLLFFQAAVLLETWCVFNFGEAQPPSAACASVDVLRRSAKRF